MTAHLFVVDRHTFVLHQKYGFAGTGDGSAGFNVKMATDLARVRPGDEVFFYVQKQGFAGTWTASGEPYLAEPSHLSQVFGKRLPYRVPIERLTRFSSVITEAEALDVLPELSADLLWSPIYRKLRGGRGCSTLLPREAVRLTCLLEAASEAGCLPDELKLNDAKLAVHEGVPIVPGLLREDAWTESDLELAVIHDFKIGGPLSLMLKVNPSRIEFLGNQVYAGVGMQAIDILIGTERRWLILELKMGYLNSQVVKQMTKYGRHLAARLGATEISTVEHVAITKQPMRVGRAVAAARNVLDGCSASGALGLYCSIEWTRSQGRLEFAKVL